MKKILAILSFGFCLATAGAQQSTHVCGTTINDQLQYESRLDANLAASNNITQVKERGVIQYVPIHFHLVGDASGAGKVKERQVLEQLCSLNDVYAPMDIRFYLSPHPTYGLFDYSINNNNVYGTQTNTLLMNSRKHAGALNVFVVNGITPSDVAAYYNTTNDWVVSVKIFINGSAINATLPHEIGHFFSLWHTFLGFEVNPFTTTSAGWPVAPVISPLTGIGTIYTEYQNGSNCATAADKICDTPPDYNFGSLVGTCLNYNSGAKDPGGTLVDPMENNYMGYFTGCNYVFTPNQQSTILADRETPQRDYLDNNFSPVSTSITTPATDDFLVSPAAGVTTTYFDEVLFEWIAVPGATYYLLEMDIVSTFNTTNYKSYVLTGTSKMLTDLDDDRQYFWRVRPFNEYATCAEFRQRSFKTSTTSGVRNIEALTALQLAPNPVSEETTRLFVSAADPFEATVRILDATGRQMLSLGSLTFSSGENTLDLPVKGLSNGLYLVVVENGKGRVVRKLSIAR